MLRRETINPFFGIVLIAVFLIKNYGLVFAWGCNGHKVIAHIAEFNLSSEAKKYIAAEFNINNVVDVANWADIIRQKKGKMKNPGIIQI